MGTSSPFERDALRSTLGPTCVLDPARALRFGSGAASGFATATASPVLSAAAALSAAISTGVRVGALLSEAAACSGRRKSPSSALFPSADAICAAESRRGAWGVATTSAECARGLTGSS